MGVFKRHTLSTTDGETKHEKKMKNTFCVEMPLQKTEKRKKKNENIFEDEEKTEEERIKFASFNTRFQHENVVIKSGFSSEEIKIESPRFSG